MAPIGEILRDERLRRGLKLEQVTECTKIGQAHLQAIETNRFDRLPCGLYARSFIRQYTRMLDLDEELLIASFKEQFEQPILPLPALYSRTLHLSLTPSFGLLGVLSIAAGAIYTLREDMRRSDLSGFLYQSDRESIARGGGTDLIPSSGHRFACV
jgi:cytoskeletal protein RodZ